jgi:hypothetical protein
MSSMQAIGRRLLLLVALIAMMHGLVHTHAIDALTADHAATSAQSCILCVTAHSADATVAPHVAPPAAHDVAEAALVAGVTTRTAEETVPSRAPPQA